MWYPNMDEKTFLRLQDQELRRQFEASRNLSIDISRLSCVTVAGVKRVWKLLTKSVANALRVANVVPPIRHH
jgi:hypothetical protein